MEFIIAIVVIIFLIILDLPRSSTKNYLDKAELNSNETASPIAYKGPTQKNYSTWVSDSQARRAKESKELLESLRDDTNPVLESTPEKIENIPAARHNKPSSRKNQIRDNAKYRKIDHLIHFTQAKNLASILEHGLVPKSELTENNISFSDNDELRLDGHPDSVSLSISFPNYKMLYKYRSQMDTNKGDTDFVVLEIHRKVLWKLDLAFCQNNAASSSIRQTDIATLRTADRLEAMFSDDDEGTRENDRLKSFDPTDSQAELLSFSTISPEHIVSVNFENKRAYLRDACKQVNSLSQVDPYYFKSRRAARYGYATRIHKQA